MLVLLVASGAAAGISTTIGAFTIGIDQSQSQSQNPGALVPAGYTHEFDGTHSLNAFSRMEITIAGSL